MNTKTIEKIANEFQKELKDFRKFANELHRDEVAIISKMDTQYPKFEYHKSQIECILWNLNQIIPPSYLITYFKNQLMKLIDEYKQIWDYIKAPAKIFKPNFCHSHGSKPNDDDTSDSPERTCFPKGKPH